MTVKCRLIDESEVDYSNPKPGDMWYDKGARDASYLSDHYKIYNKPYRDPIWVVLPNGDFFCVDAHMNNSVEGWIVSGEAPNITVEPSIKVLGLNFEEIWHGYLRNGEFT